MGAVYFRFASKGALAAFPLIAFGRWFCASAVTFPEEIRLLQSLMGEWRSHVPMDEVSCSTGSRHDRCAMHHMKGRGIASREHHLHHATPIAPIPSPGS